MTVAPKLPVLPLREEEFLEEWEDEEEDEFYITSDGKPMAETVQHRDLMMYCIPALNIYFADRDDVYVSGNDFIHHREGDQKAHVSPDCYIVFGVGKQLRTCYKVWEEGGHYPDVIIEFTSEKTRRQDFGKKKDLYEQEFKTAEYYTFDPTGVRRKVRLQGFLLRNGRYEAWIPEADGRLHSEKLGLDLVPDGTWLRLYDPDKGEYLRTSVESEQERIAAEQRADAEAVARMTEARRAREAERRAATAEAELERLRAELGLLCGHFA